MKAQKFIQLWKVLSLMWGKATPQRLTEIKNREKEIFAAMVWLEGYKPFLYKWVTSKDIIAREHIRFDSDILSGKFSIDGGRLEILEDGCEEWQEVNANDGSFIIPAIAFAIANVLQQDYGMEVDYICGTIDFFEYPDLQPKNVQEVIRRYYNEDMTYAACERLKKALQRIGWDINYGLGSVPFDLHPM